MCMELAKTMQTHTVDRDLKMVGLSGNMRVTGNVGEESLMTIVVMGHVRIKAIIIASYYVKKITLSRPETAALLLPHISCEIVRLACCSGEKGVWQPAPPDILRLCERLSKGETLELEWKCGERRSPSPEQVKVEEEEVPVVEDKQEQVK